jgi:predicted Zn-dependent peptidase
MIKKHTLDNGIRIVMEKIDYVRSASIGIWVNVGSNNENEETNGFYSDYYSLEANGF